MIRRMMLLFVLSSFTAVAAAGVPRPDAVTPSPFGQRMSDRFTPGDGLPEGPVTAVAVSSDGVRVQTAAGSATLVDGHWNRGGKRLAVDYPFLNRKALPAGTHVRGAARDSRGTVWVVSDRGAMRSDGDRFGPVSVKGALIAAAGTAGTQIGQPDYTSAAADSKGHVWLGALSGVFASSDGENWTLIDGRRGLPYEHVTSLAVGMQGDLWVGTVEGVCHRGLNGKWEYYWGRRWLPDNRVNALAAAPDGVWVATNGGVAHLYHRQISLEEKSRHYEEITQARHSRRGYITWCGFKVEGDPKGGLIRFADDNDGLWSGMYVAAEAFRYGATHDPEARALAKKSMDAMLDLLTYTGSPGFPARAIVYKGEDIAGYDEKLQSRIEGKDYTIWFQSPVNPNILCKGDTSSDELDGHYWAWYVYHDLVADAAEKKRIEAACAAVTDNIIAHDFNLVGPTGYHTRWGVWAPKYLNDDPVWRGGRGLNSLEILSHLKVAYHLTGNPKYQEAYLYLINKHHYLTNTIDQRATGDWWRQNHSDDELAACAYYPIMQLEKDPELRKVLVRSLETTWAPERAEHSSFLNFIYGSGTDSPCDVEESLQNLRDWPWELICWECDNRHRADVQITWAPRPENAESGRGPRNPFHTDRVLPASERVVAKWNEDPFVPSGRFLRPGTGNSGYAEQDGMSWLLPYWMGRYHGMIAATK